MKGLGRVKALTDFVCKWVLLGAALKRVRDGASMTAKDTIASRGMRITSRSPPERHSRPPFPGDQNVTVILRF